MITWTAGKRTDIDVSKLPTYEGKVLRLAIRCNRVMSDIYADEYYAVVWNGETETEIKVNSSFELYRGPFGKPTVDATPEVLAEHAAWQEGEDRARKLLELKMDLKRAMHDARLPSIGKLVRVVRGRKVPLGTEGTIFWVGRADYGAGSEKCGIALDNEKDDRGRHKNVAWSYLRNVEAVLDDDTVRRFGERETAIEQATNSRTLAEVS